MYEQHQISRSRELRVFVHYRPICLVYVWNLYHRNECADRHTRNRRFTTSIALSRWIRVSLILVEEQWPRFDPSCSHLQSGAPRVLPRFLPFSEEVVARWLGKDFETQR